MAETSTRSTPDLGAAADGLSPRARIWLLAVASMDVLLVISSMVALNAALPDIAVQTSASQSQLTWIVDGYTLALEVDGIGRVKAGPLSNLRSRVGQNLLRAEGGPEY